MKRQHPTPKSCTAERMVMAACVALAGRCSSSAFVSHTIAAGHHHHPLRPLALRITPPGSSRCVGSRPPTTRNKHSGSGAAGAGARRRLGREPDVLPRKGPGVVESGGVGGSVGIGSESGEKSGITLRSSPLGDGEKGLQQLPYGTDYHVPVVCREVLEWLITDREGVYVDCTLGGGGHSAALLGALGNGAKVVGIDRDPAALKEASARLSAEATAGRFQAVRANFADVTRAVRSCEFLIGDKDRRIPTGRRREEEVNEGEQEGGGEGDEQQSSTPPLLVDGILVDLGVSSRQIDDGARGFSFSSDGPLDMRMDGGSGFDESGNSGSGSSSSTYSRLPGRDDGENRSPEREEVSQTAEEKGRSAVFERTDDDRHTRRNVQNGARNGLENGQSNVPDPKPSTGDGRGRGRDGWATSDGSLSAADVVNFVDEREIREVIFRFGEEMRSTKIARAIVSNRPLTTTGHLAEVVGKCAPPNERTKTLARVFQALRIKVNGELDALEALLDQAKGLVKPGGRLLVLSYHSLEDRRVKRVLATGNLQGAVVKDFYGNRLSPWKPLTRKPLQATEEEVALNPRARSVRLRVAERTVFQ